MQSLRLLQRTPPMAAQKNKDAPRLTEVRNAKVFRDYEVGERFEAGIKLHGTEVKSVRSGKAQISDSFCRIDKGEVWMLGAHIDPSAPASSSSTAGTSARSRSRSMPGARRWSPSGCTSRGP
jgi:SsrA-binding protein